MPPRAPPYHLAMKLLPILLAAPVFAASTVMAQPADAVPPAGGLPPEPAPAGTGTAVPLAPIPAPAPLAEAGVLEDANIGRTWLSPTGLMAPKGTWSFSDWELFFIGASYAPTDDTSVSAMTIIPLSSDMPFLGMFTGKARVVHQPRVHVALQATAFVALDDDDNYVAGNLGGVATYCTSADCASNVSAFAGVGLVEDSGAAVPLTFSASVVQRLGKRVKLVLEADTGAVVGNYDSEIADGFLLWYGLRFHSANIGVDLGLVKPIYEGSADDELLPLGFPMLSFQYRGLPTD